MKMKIFASWSGQQSKRIAFALKEWLPDVLQFADIFMSEQDIASGDRGLTSIENNLGEGRFGIVVLTKTNFTAPWILFEAGALSNTLPGKVAPLLCDMDPLSLLHSPLQQFQHNKFDEEGIRKLVNSVNAASQAPIDKTRLHKSFDVWWPKLDEEYRKIMADHPDELSAPPKEDKIASALAQIIDELGQQRRTQVVMQGIAFETLKRLSGAIPLPSAEGFSLELRPPAWASSETPTPGGVRSRLASLFVDSPRDNGDLPTKTAPDGKGP